MNLPNPFRIVVVFSLFLIPSVSSAAFVMRFSDPDDSFLLPVVVVDNGIGDLDPTTGIIDPGPLVIGNMMLGFTNAGFSKPAYSAGVNKAAIELHVEVLSMADGFQRVQIDMTDTDFSLPTATDWTMTTSIGGITYGAVDFEEILDPTNSEFADPSHSDQTVNSLGPLTGVAPFFGADPVFSASTTSLVVVQDNPFSLTESVVIEHNAIGDWTSFDANSVVCVLPEPASILTWLAFGSAIGLWQIRSLRNRKSE